MNPEQMLLLLGVGLGIPIGIIIHGFYIYFKKEAQSK